MGTRPEHTLIAILALAALWLRVPLALGRSFWYDEAMAWKIASYEWPTMLAKARLDVHPPLYWAMVKVQGWVFGDSALALRAMSLVQVPIQMFLMARICRWPSPVLAGSPRSPRDAALVGAALVAFNPTLTMTTAEARMYTTGITLALACALALLGLLTLDGKERSYSLALGLAGTLFAYTHYHALFWLASAYLFGLAFLARRRPAGSRRKWIGLIASGAFIALAFAPWVPSLLDQCAVTGEVYWMGVPSEGPNPLRYLADFWSTPRSFIGAGTFSRESNGPTLLACAGFLALMGWLARRDVVQQLALTLLVLPVVIASVAGQLGNLPTIHGRFLQFALVFSAVGPARSLAALPSRPLALIIACGLSLQLVYFDLMFRDSLPTGIAQAVEEIRRSARPGDLVYSNSSYVFLPAKHAFRRRLPVFLTEQSTRRFHCPFLIDDGELGQPQVSSLADRAAPTIWAIEAPGKGQAVQPPESYRAVDRRIFFDFVPLHLTLTRYQPDTGQAGAPSEEE